MKKVSTIILSICLLSALLWNCKDNLSPAKFDESAFPAMPTQFNAFVGDGSIMLRWSYPDITTVDYFQIFKGSARDSAFAELDTTSQLEYTDWEVNNSTTYRYAISAVKDGVQGAKVFKDATASVYGITINSRIEFINSRTVVLTLIAPQNTTFMRIANDSTFTNSIWEPYAGTKNWMLTENDGLKTVYVHFRDAEGNETFTPLSTQIILDTRAEILALWHDAVNTLRSVGDTIRFTMNTGETKGTAAIDIGAARTNIRLYDDATNGDDVADDGFYKRNFVVPPAFEVKDVAVVGHFTDQLGNNAEDFQAKDLLTIQNSPNNVTLLNPEQIPGSFKSLRLTWTRSIDEDFAGYKLYRSTSPGVTSNSTFVTSIESINTLSFVDTDLNENTIYYYQLYVFDTNGNSTESNEVSGSTLRNEPPDAVTLVSVEAPSNESRSLIITWTRNDDVDFANYRLYRSKTAAVDLNSTPVTTVTSASTLTFTDTGLEENTIYFYRVYVFDAGGLPAGSNELSGTTNQNIAPESINVFAPTPVANSTTSLKLSWTQSPDDDFASYKIYRALNSPVNQDCTFVESIENVSTLTYTDENLKENTTYFYRVYVYDTGGLFSESNEVSGKTSRDEPPDAVTLLPIEIIPGATTSLRLAWTQNNNQDFASYKIYRSLTSGVSTNSVLVTSINTRSTLSFTNENLTENTVYYYKVYVFDSAGLSTGSNEQNGQTPVNEAPQAVSLLPIETIQGSTTSLRLTWTQNNDPDFASYKIYRSLTPNVTTNSVFVTSVESRTQLSHVDSGLNENTAYYYKVYIFDTGGLSTPSNELPGTTPVNEPPAPVTLLKPEPLESAPTTLRISWTKNNDADFANYKIYRSKTANVTTQSTFVTSIENGSTLSYQDAGLDESTTYFYKIYVFDTGGLSAGSNEDSGTTLANTPPSPVTLTQPTPNGSALQLSWSQSTENDFASYRIYRSTSSPVDTTVAPIAIQNNRTSTSYSDSNITAGVDYFYRVFVVDTNGLSAGSNEVTGKL